MGMRESDFRHLIGQNARNLGGVRPIPGPSMQAPMEPAGEFTAEGAEALEVHDAVESMMEETSTDMEALARRAVACKGWRWMPGMAARDGCRVVSKDGDGFHVEPPHNRPCTCPNARSGDDERAIPDLSDPATVGCLLALVREAWGDPQACVMKGAFIGWRVYAGLGKPVQDWEPRDHHPTEATALIAALEAAPC